MLRNACTNSGIKRPRNAKFLGAPCFRVTVRFPNFNFRPDPVVRKIVFIGTCVENPKRLAAVAPVGITFALSRLEISFTNS